VKLKGGKRLKKQFDFIKEIDAVKNIIRKSKLYKSARYENDAEHSWHFAVMAAVLAEYSNVRVDILKVIKMGLIHDIPEIYAGDVMIYKKSKKDEVREKKAAIRRFSKVPPDQAREFYSLWLEFEARLTPEAKFASAIDRLEPVMLNCLNNGGAWKKHGIPAEQVMAVNKRIGTGSEKLWRYAKEMIGKIFPDLNT
jgi:putative hydrolase of HD superfamily